MKPTSILSPDEFRSWPSEALRLRQEVRDRQEEITHEEVVERMNIVQELRIRSQLLFQVSSGEYIKTIQSWALERIEAVLRDIYDKIDDEETMCDAEFKIWHALEAEQKDRRILKGMDDAMLLAVLRSFGDQMDNSPDAVVVRRYTDCMKEAKRRGLLELNS